MTDKDNPDLTHPESPEQDLDMPPLLERSRDENYGSSDNEIIPPIITNDLKVARGRHLPKSIRIPSLLIVRRVAKAFEGDICYGTIEKYHPPSQKHNKSLWTIKYDDDDVEDYEAEDILGTTV